ncbi:unnamed protein product [Amoebophrya sp. A120]|nr:unnamed protein product [Amoebophrya sp. A120]|eukprot:GSA120T00015149001.1
MKRSPGIYPLPAVISTKTMCVKSSTSGYGREYRPCSLGPRDEKNETKARSATPLEAYQKIDPGATKANFDALVLDCEGCAVDFLRAYLTDGQLGPDVRYISVEVHSIYNENVEDLEKILTPRGYVLQATVGRDRFYSRSH